MDCRAVYYTCGNVARPDRDGTWRMVSDPRHPQVRDPLQVEGRERVAELRQTVLGNAFEIRNGGIVLNSQASILEQLAERKLPADERVPATIAVRALIYHLKGIIIAYTKVRGELIPILSAARAAKQKTQGLMCPSVDDAHHEWTALAAALARLGCPPEQGLEPLPRRLSFDASIGGFPRFRLPLAAAPRREESGWDLLLEGRARVAEALDQLELRWRQRSQPS